MPRRGHCQRTTNASSAELAQRHAELQSDYAALAERVGQQHRVLQATVDEVQRQRRLPPPPPPPPSRSRSRSRSNLR